MERTTFNRHGLPERARLASLVESMSWVLQLGDRYPHQFEEMSAILMRLPQTSLALICT